MLLTSYLIGIRSQSPPQDIMAEIFRAMKALDFVRISQDLSDSLTALCVIKEWKIVSPYSLCCQQHNKVTGHYVRN